MTSVEIEESALGRACCRNRYILGYIVIAAWYWTACLCYLGMTKIVVCTCSIYVPNHQTSTNLGISWLFCLIYMYLFIMSSNFYQDELSHVLVVVNRSLSRVALLLPSVSTTKSTEGWVVHVRFLESLLGLILTSDVDMAFKQQHLTDEMVTNESHEDGLKLRQWHRQLQQW